MAILWIAVAVVLIGFELHHLAFFAMFGAAGAVAAAAVAAFAPSAFVPQIAVGAAVAAVGVVAVRPQVSEAFARRGPGVSVRGVHGGLVGARGITLDVVSLDHRGHIRLLGENWLAMTVDAESIPPATPVVVTQVVGTTLTVRAVEHDWELTP